MRSLCRVAGILFGLISLCLVIPGAYCQKTEVTGDLEVSADAAVGGAVQNGNISAGLTVTATQDAAAAFEDKGAGFGLVGQNGYSTVVGAEKDLELRTGVTGGVATGTPRMKISQQGDVTIQDAVKIEGGENEEAVIYLSSDEGDDDGDMWAMAVNQSTNDMEVRSFSSGFWDTFLKLTTSGTTGILKITQSAIQVEPSQGNAMLIATTPSGGDATVRASASGADTDAVIQAIADGYTASSDALLELVTGATGSAFTRYARSGNTWVTGFYNTTDNDYVMRTNSGEQVRFLEQGGIVVYDGVPSSYITDASIFYADNGDMYFWNDQGTGTQITSHRDPREIGGLFPSSFEDPSVTLPFSFHHKSSVIGKGQVIDMAKMAAFVEALMVDVLGEEDGRLIQDYDLPSSETLTVDQLKRQRILASSPWVVVKEISEGGAIPEDAFEDLEITTTTTVQESIEVIERDATGNPRVARRDVSREVAVGTGEYMRQLRKEYKLEDGVLYRLRTADEVTNEELASIHLQEWIEKRLTPGWQGRKAIPETINWDRLLDRNALSTGDVEASGNIEEGSGSFVLGGEMNATSGDRSAVLAGDANLVGASDSVVVGGRVNEISGARSVILGGQGNRLHGSEAVALGDFNRSDAENSFVGGQNIHLTAEGANSFVWNSTPTTTTVSSPNGFFIFPAPGSGAMAIGTNAISANTALEVAGGDIRLSGGSFIDDGSRLETPDYVLEPDYDLMTLEELRRHIEEKKHLPNVPNAADIQENGLDLGEFQMRLLEKVEELTLYTLAQQDQLDTQARLLEEQRVLIESQQALMAKLQAKIETDD